MTKVELVIFIQYTNTFEGEAQSIRISIPMAPQKAGNLRTDSLYPHGPDEVV